jgi:hypothetical protein
MVRVDQPGRDDRAAELDALDVIRRLGLRAAA